MNTGTARIVIIVTLVVVGGLLLANAFDDSGVAAAGGPSGAVTSPSPSASSSPTGTTQSTQTPPPTPDPQPPKDVSVAVFNGTDSPGLAGIVMQDLLGHGYKQGQVPADAPNKPVAKTVIYYVSGADAEQNKSNATALGTKYYPDAKVQELDQAYTQDSTVAKAVQVVVVIGANDAPA